MAGRLLFVPLDLPETGCCVDSRPGASRLHIILACLHDPISVTTIAARLNLSQPLVSHHLRLLRAARILRAERRGKQICYSAADEHIQCVIEDMIAHVGEPGDIEESA